MVWAKIPQTPTKQTGRRSPPPHCRVPMIGRSQRPRAPPHDATCWATVAAQLFVHSSFVPRSPPPRNELKPIQVEEISSEHMEEDIEVVEELSRPPRVAAVSSPTLPGDITSTNNMISTEYRISPVRVLDLSEEMDRLAVIQQDVIREAREHIARMNSLGLFMDPSEMNWTSWPPHEGIGLN